MPINEAQAQVTATTYRGEGRYPSGLHDGAETGTAASGQTKAEVPLTMETVITRENLILAYQRVVENKGAAGTDNLSVAELKLWLKKHWPVIRQALFEGNYQPQAIRRVDIPKPEDTGYPDGCGQAHSAGDSATVKRYRGQRLLGLQLRLQAGPHAWQTVQQV